MAMSYMQGPGSHIVSMAIPYKALTATVDRPLWKVMAVHIKSRRFESAKFIPFSIYGQTHTVFCQLSIWHTKNTDRLTGRLLLIEDGCGANPFLRGHLELTPATLNMQSIGWLATAAVNV